MADFNLTLASTPDLYEKLMREHARGYKAVRFLGRGRYQRSDFLPTLEEAVEVARAIFVLDEQHRDELGANWLRPIAIYAIANVGGCDHSLHVKNVWRDGVDRPSPSDLRKRADPVRHPRDGIVEPRHEVPGRFLP